MTSTSNTTKQVWLLYVKKMQDGKEGIIPIKVFTTKEIAFTHYPGNWEPEGKFFYILDFHRKASKTEAVQGFLLCPIDFYDETDVTN